ncbi:SLAP domain-containing protein [Companilactobacillus kimchiensis]|nr:SLAP domain-containing protein [Companilactobacillus kimchiensis]
MPLKVSFHLVTGTGNDDATVTPPSLDSVTPDLRDFSFHFYLSKININKNNVNVATGSNFSRLTDATNDSKNGLSVTDNYSNENNNKSAIAREPIYGESLYKESSLQKAFSDASAADFDPKSTNGDATDVIGNGKIVKAGTYYQAVTYKMDDGEDTAIQNIVGVKKDDLTHGYLDPYETFINGDDDANKVAMYKDTDTTPNANTQYVLNRNPGLGTITVFRKINVPGKITDSLNTPSVTVGTTTKDSALNKTDGISLIDQDKDNLIDDPSKIVLDDTYYDSSTDPKTILDGTATPSISPDGKFTKAGQYYRKVTIPLKSGISGNDYKFNGDYQLSTDGASVTFLQKVIVQPKANSGSGSHSGSNSGSGSNNNNNGHNWTTEDIKGIVTTKKDQPYYSLNNTEDKTVSDRALAENTAWLTDRSRTDQNGNKQYRVSTSEWIDAKYVNFNEMPDSLSDVQSSIGILYADKTKEYYRLYNKDDQLVPDRALGKGTYWKVDQTAHDADGKEYYRVSTNEWVKQVDGIHYPVSLGEVE